MHRNRKSSTNVSQMNYIQQNKSYIFFNSPVISLNMKMTDDIYKIFSLVLFSIYNSFTKNFKFQTGSNHKRALSKEFQMRSCMAHVKNNKEIFWHRQH